MTLGNEMHDAGKRRDETYVCCGLDMVTKINRVADGIDKNARSTETQWVGAWPRKRETENNELTEWETEMLSALTSFAALSRLEMASDISRPG